MALLTLGMLTACSLAVTEAVVSIPIATPATTIAAKTWWQPEPGLSWQIQYVGELELDLGVAVYNLDLFEISETDVAALHAQGARVICYLNAGAWEDWRPDSTDFPEAVLGQDYTGWPGERWLDIRQIEALAPLMNARLDLCAEKGFDGVDPDNLDGYTNATGFELDAADQLAYNRWLAEAAHARGLGIGLKNDAEQAADLVDAFDWVTVESCFHEDGCDPYDAFIAVGKPVFAIEYTDNDTRLTDFCEQAGAFSIDALLKHRDLDAWRAACP